MKNLWYNGFMLSIACATSKGAETKLNDFTLGLWCLIKYLKTKFPPKLVPMTCKGDLG
jgi:hypothetical protein